MKFDLIADFLTKYDKSRFYADFFGNRQNRRDFHDMGGVQIVLIFAHFCINVLSFVLFYTLMKSEQERTNL